MSRETGCPYVRLMLKRIESLQVCSDGGRSEFSLLSFSFHLEADSLTAGWFYIPKTVSC